MFQNTLFFKTSYTANSKLIICSERRIFLSYRVGRPLGFVSADEKLKTCMYIYVSRNQRVKSILSIS